MTPEITSTAVQTNLNVVWTLIAAILVFMMQAGFALVETGFTRAKNAANIVWKKRNVQSHAPSPVARDGMPSPPQPNRPAAFVAPNMSAAPRT